MKNTFTVPDDLQRRRHPQGPRKKAVPVERPRLSQLKHKALEFGVPYASMRDRAQAGEFSIFTIGRIDYVSNDEIDQWLERKRTRP